MYNTVYTSSRDADGCMNVVTFHLDCLSFCQSLRWQTYNNEKILFDQRSKAKFYLCKTYRQLQQCMGILSPGKGRVVFASPDKTFSADGASPDGDFGDPSLPLPEVE